MVLVTPEIPHEKKVHTRWKFQLKTSQAKLKTLQLGDRNPLLMVFSKSILILSENFICPPPWGPTPRPSTGCTDRWRGSLCTGMTGLTLD